MTILRVGTNEKYASGWEAIFGGTKKAKSTVAVEKTKATASKSTVTKSAKKSAKATAKPVAKKAAKKAAAPKKAAKKSTKR